MAASNFTCVGVLDLIIEFGEWLFSSITGRWTLLVAITFALLAVLMIH